MAQPYQLQNPRVDKFSKTIGVNFDAKKRIELYQEYQRILNDEQPYTFLYARSMSAQVHRRFENVEAYPEGLKPPTLVGTGSSTKYT